MLTQKLRDELGVRFGWAVFAERSGKYTVRWIGDNAPSPDVGDYTNLDSAYFRADELNRELLMVDAKLTMVGKRSLYGSRWLHTKSGRVYTVMSLVIREHDLCPCVVYQDDHGDGVSWVRPLEEFCDGRFKEYK